MIMIIEISIFSDNSNVHSKFYVPLQYYRTNSLHDKGGSGGGGCPPCPPNGSIIVSPL